MPGSISLSQPPSLAPLLLLVIRVLRRPPFSPSPSVCSSTTPHRAARTIATAATFVAASLPPPSPLPASRKRETPLWSSRARETERACYAVQEVRVSAIPKRAVSSSTRVGFFHSIRPFDNLGPRDDSPRSGHRESGRAAATRIGRAIRCAIRHRRHGTQVIGASYGESKKKLSLKIDSAGVIASAMSKRYARDSMDSTPVASRWWQASLIQ